MEKVALLRCEEYDVDLIEKKLREGFGLLGGEEYLRKLIPEGSTRKAKVQNRSLLWHLREESTSIL